MSRTKTVAVAGLAMLLIGAAQCTAEPNVPALKDVFKAHFLIGGAPNRSVVTGRDPNAAAIAEKHFNTITPENDLKWQLVHPRPGQYNWGPADSFVAFGEKNEMFLVGHTLVWHSQTPRWVFQDEAGDPLTRDALLARMKDHILSVVGRYKGRIKGWDVVNEALNENGTLRDSPWLRIIGEGAEDKKYDFIEYAFRWAHEADPDAELYYNDYNLETSRAKCDGAAAIVEHLKSKGLRIDGVGIQLHAGLTRPSVEDLEYAITSLAATGVKVMVTELDIRTQTRGYRGADVSRVSRAGTDDPTAATAETQKRLAEKYAEIFSVLLKHKKDVTRVTFWGIYDRTSWIGGSPLLFDRDYQPKEAFFAVVKTALAAPASVAASNKTYTNPIIDEIGPADPTVILFEGTYYLYPTGDNVSYHVYTSTDLVHWTKGPRVFEPGERNVWAPDVFRDPKDGRFYLYYTVGERIGVAVADRPDGTFVSRATLFDRAIDAHMFCDDDGRYYLYYVQFPGFRIHVQPMKNPLEKLGEPVELLYPTEPWEKIRGDVTEGPWMLKHKGTYYLLYSGTGANSLDYAIGYATADKPIGPFTKYAGNPIVKRTDQAFGPGHGCVVTDHAGNLWSIYHQQKDDSEPWNRFVCIDPLWFDDEGVLHGKATRGTPQPAPIIHK